ncbi:hypothetical protein ACFCW6_34250 [Streptomyces sp. NPDC056333]|uniref:hypothetical protein n=1 Tax=Streptomyces sp. NPDC056333 TaxID=3345786 RepID=UPI0035DD7F17
MDLLDPVLRGEAPEPGPLVEGIALRRAGWRSLRDTEGRSAPVAGEVTGFPAGTPYPNSLADLQPRLISHLDADAPSSAAETPLPSSLVSQGRSLTVHGSRQVIQNPSFDRAWVLTTAAPGCFWRKVLVMPKMSKVELHAAIRRGHRAPV